MSPPKTKKLCSFYPTNSCNKGNSCPFSHELELPPRVVCPHYMAGTCMFGERCRNIHEKPGGGSITPKTLPCIFWKEGRCSKGDQCKFLHEPLSSDLSWRERQSNRSSPSAFSWRLCSRPQDLVATTESKDKSNPGVSHNGDEHGYSADDRSHEQADAQRKDPIFPEHVKGQEPASSETTIERLFSDCTRASIGSGGEITKVLTAFESRRVTLSNLPDETSHQDIISMAENFGPLKSVVLVPSVSGTKRKAELEYLDPDCAKMAAVALDEMELHTRCLAAQLDLRSAETGAADLRSSTLKMSWFAPSRIAYAHYGSIHLARQKALELNGRNFAARKVSAAFQQPSFRQKHNFTVIVKGLPLRIPFEELKKFCASDSVNIGEANYHGKQAAVHIQERLEDFGPLESFDLSHPTLSDLKVKALVRFAKPEHAAAAYKQLQGQSQTFLGGAKTWLTLLHSVKYNIPKVQFEVLKDNLLQLQGEGVQSAKVRVYDKDEAGRAVDPVCLRIYGDDPRTLGRLKTNVERLLSGEAVTHEGNGEFILWKGSQEYVEQVHKESGAYVSRDPRRKTLRISGSPQQKDRARELLLQKVEELRAQRHHLQLTKADLGKLLQGELARLQAALGEEKLSLDVRNRILIVRGDDETIEVARLSLKTIDAGVAMPATDGDAADCPVCFCDVTNPVKLTCGHSYCYACLRHYLASAENFPVKCLGEDGHCYLSIPLSTITHMLPPEEETEFFDTAFLAYIHQHPKDFHHCPTPDCPTIYRPAEPGIILRCPSCLARICPSCHVEFHEGLSCAEHHDNQTGGDLSFQKWKEANDVQSCPNCKADIEKSMGCNHMTCIRCRTHMCWVCRATFPGGKGIYEHMQDEHGGLGL